MGLDLSGIRQDLNGKEILLSRIRDLVYVREQSLCLERLVESSSPVSVSSPNPNGLCKMYNKHILIIRARVSCWCPLSKLIRNTKLN